MILLYDFEGVGYEAAHGVQTVPNHGSAGADYDLMLGRLAKPAGGELFGLSYVDGSSVQRPFIPPVVVPSSESTAWPTPRAQDPAAPIVVTCAAGETVAISQHGVSTSYTAPSPFAATATFSSGGTSIEVVPLMPPTAHTLSATGLEDGAVPIRLFATYASGLPVEVVLMTPPAKGTLHEIAHCDSTALLTPLAAPGAVADATGLCVLYRPDQDAHGAPHDSFSYAVRYVARPTLVSNTATVTLNVKSFDDLPSTASQSVVMVEDGGPVLISLAAADPDAGTPLDMYIATLPTRGKLYLTSDGTLAGERTLIDRPYSFFDVGSDVQAQYLDQVVAVSSFWGLPPDASYHPLTVLGPPDCSTQGECKTEDLRPGLNWLSDATVYPPIGQRVLHAGLVAFVAAVNATASTVDLHYHRMYKPDAAAGGALRQCQFDPAQPALRTYPDHCDFALAPAGGGVLARTAPRAELSGMAAGAWSPLRKAYMGNLTSAGGGAFGPQYVFAHNQAEHYPLNTPPYTEYIEVSLAQSTYLVSLELGSPRGMGHVVNLKAWQDSAQAWVSFYQGAPRVEEAAAYMETKRYWRWAPDVCRLHFPVQRLRIEVDTSLETGVSDWNYIDYVLVHGEMSAIQPAALRTGVPYVVYVPDQDEEGDDEFTYVATDCPGSMLRSSTADGAAAGTVTIRINATNDAPVATPQTLQLPVDTSQTLLVLAAADVDSTALTYTITSLPPDVRVRGGDDSGGSGGGADVSEGAALSSPFLTLSSSTCGASPLAFTVSDGELTSAPATTTVEVVCPRACSEADMEVRVSACDDGAQRLASWNWTAGTTCDLPRAKPLLEDVTIQCDHIAWGSPSAVAVIAVAALLIACKLGLLLYFLRYRHTPAFKQSQSTFGVLCIVGGIAADLTPLQLLGETSTSRCMRFPTWLLVSVTMLYGPLVLKTWKVWKVFDNPSLKELRLSNSRLIGYLALVILLEVGLAVVFGAAMPLEALEYNYTFSAGNGVLPRTRCSEDNTIFHLVAYAIVAVPLCAGLFLAFKTRRVHGDYTDNKSTLLSLYTLVLAALVLIPVTRILGDNTRATFLMVSIGVLFVSTVSVLLFTLPKVLYHRGCLLSPAQVATNQPTSMHASSVLGGGSAMGSDLAADELAELRAEVCDAPCTTSAAAQLAPHLHITHPHLRRLGRCS